MNDQHPELPKADNDILKIDAMFEQSLRIFKGFAAKRCTEYDPPKKMFSDGDDKGDDRGDAGVTAASVLSVAGASAAGTAGASSAGNDKEDTESDNNQPEPGYEFYLDECGVRKVRKIRQEDDADYVPSDTEAERLKRKQIAAHRKKKARKNIGSSSVQQPVPQQEPIQEANMNPNLGFTADEAATFISSPPR
ncbi:hypothetical protein Hanom_Chr11g01036311 [Helianthus anomalus]